VCDQFGGDVAAYISKSLLVCVCGTVWKFSYADEKVVIGRRLQDVEDVFMSLVEQTNKMGLEINKNKKRQNL
jgi:hypothetical protein